jgi:hypothetical protein
LQHGEIEAHRKQHLFDAHLLPMMRHRLDLRMQHRVIDEALDAMRARRNRDCARVCDLVAAHIRADVINRLRACRSLRQRPGILETAEADFGNAERQERTGMVRIADEGPHPRALRRQRSHHGLAALAGRTGDENHRTVTTCFIAIWPSARTNGRG